MDDWFQQFKHRLGDVLSTIDKSLDPYSKQLKETERASQEAAQKAEAVAKATHIDQVAEAVQTVDAAHSVAKGGIKLIQVMRDPEARAAVAKLLRRAPDAWDTAKAMMADRRAFEAQQAERRAILEAAKNLKTNTAPRGPLGAAVSNLKALEAQSARIEEENARLIENTKEAQQLMEGINPTGSTGNCQSAFVALHHRLHGMGELVAADHGPANKAYLESLFNREFQDVKGMDDVVAQLKASGNGSSGALWFWDKTGEMSHGVMAFHVDGRVMLLDAQNKLVLPPDRLAEIVAKVGNKEIEGYAFLPTPPPTGCTPVIGKEPFFLPSFGMRPEDKAIFQQAARDQNRWLLVRHTNPESLPYVGEPGYVPKRIDCKAKSADVPGHPHAGLVADPHFHHSAYSDPVAAQQRWDEMLRDLPPRYKVDLDPSSPRYRCLQLEDKYIHADYDLYDVIDPARPQANLGPVGELHGQQHIGTPRLSRISDDINGRMDSPMVQHGAEAQFIGHSEQRVMAFGPNGERFEVNGKAALENLYEQKFLGRRALDHSNPYDPHAAGFEKLGIRGVVENTRPPESTPPPRPPSIGGLGATAPGDGFPFTERVLAGLPSRELVHHADQLATEARRVVTADEKRWGITHCVTVLEKPGEGPESRRVLLTSSVIDARKELPSKADHGLVNAPVLKEGAKVYKTDGEGNRAEILRADKEHHAERKAIEFAKQNGYQVVAMAPTQGCCSSCRDYVKKELGEERFRQVVPEHRQSEEGFREWRRAGKSVAEAGQSLTGPSAEFGRGALSAKYESGGDPGRVSSGYLNKAHTKEDRGGISYGAYQFTSRYIDDHGGKHDGTVQSFVKSDIGKRWAHEFQDADGRPLKIPSPEFSARWQAIAKREPAEFKAAQHAYIEKYFYQVQAQHVQKGTGIDLEHRSRTLQNAVWSTAVQHGAGTDIVKESLNRESARQHVRPSQLSDEDCLRAIYKERMRAFPTTESRYAREYVSAAGMLQAERLQARPPANQFEFEKRQALADIHQQVVDLREKQNFLYGDPKKFVVDAKGQEHLVASIEQARQRGYLDVSTAPNSAVVHDSARNKADPLGNRFRATEYCLRPENGHCRTIEMTPGGSWLAYQDLDRNVLSGPRAERALQNLSHDFTRQAAGETRAFVGPYAGSHRAWQAEQQALRANPNVTGIETYQWDGRRTVSSSEHLRDAPLAAAAAGGSAPPRVPPAAAGAGGSSSDSSRASSQQGTVTAKAAQPAQGEPGGLAGPARRPDVWPGKDAGREADLRTANRVADGRDAATGRRPIFKATLAGSNEEMRRRDAAEYVQKQQREAAEKQLRLDQIAAQDRARQEQADRKWERDLKAGERKEEKQEAKAQKVEQKADQQKQETQKVEQKADQQKQETQNVEQKADQQKRETQNVEQTADQQKQETQNVEQKADQQKQETQNVEQTADQQKQETQNVEQKADQQKQETKNVEQKADQPKRETQNVEQKADQPKQETKNVEQKADQPKQETQNVEQKADQQKQETQNVEQKADQQKQETQNVEQKADQQKADQPKRETEQPDHPEKTEQQNSKQRLLEQRQQEQKERVDQPMADRQENSRGPSEQPNQERGRTDPQKPDQQQTPEARGDLPKHVAQGPDPHQPDQQQASEARADQPRQKAELLEPRTPDRQQSPEARPDQPKQEAQRSDPRTPDQQQTSEARADQPKQEAQRSDPQKPDQQQTPESKAEQTKQQAQSPNPQRPDQQQTPEARGDQSKHVAQGPDPHQPDQQQASEARADQPRHVAQGPDPHQPDQQQTPESKAEQTKQQAQSPNPPRPYQQTPEVRLDPFEQVPQRPDPHQPDQQQAPEARADQPKQEAQRSDPQKPDQQQTPESKAEQTKQQAQSPNPQRPYQQTPEVRLDPFEQVPQRPEPQKPDQQQAPEARADQPEQQAQRPDPQKPDQQQTPESKAEQTKQQAQSPNPQRPDQQLAREARADQPEQQAQRPDPQKPGQHQTSEAGAEQPKQQAHRPKPRQPDRQQTPEARDEQPKQQAQPDHQQTAQPRADQPRHEAQRPASERYSQQTKSDQPRQEPQRTEAGSTQRAAPSVRQEVVETKGGQRQPPSGAPPPRQPNTSSPAEGGPAPPQRGASHTGQSADDNAARRIIRDDSDERRRRDATEYVEKKNREREASEERARQRQVDQQRRDVESQKKWDRDVKAGERQPPNRPSGSPAGGQGRPLATPPPPRQPNAVPPPSPASPPPARPSPPSPGPSRSK